jgi:hypothetical protein
MSNVLDNIKKNKIIYGASVLLLLIGLFFLIHGSLDISHNEPHGTRKSTLATITHGLEDLSQCKLASKCVECQIGIEYVVGNQTYKKDMNYKLDCKQIMNGKIMVYYDPNKPENVYDSQDYTQNKDSYRWGIGYVVLGVLIIIAVIGVIGSILGSK